jgi:uncharacterized protein with NRDE domain
MCLIAFSWKQHPVYKLALVANRDEFFNRPTQALGEWPGQPLIAGKDLKEGGTWMGFHKGGRFAALTNYRDFSRESKGQLSRGLIVTDFLQSKLSPTEFIKNLQHQALMYNPFNILVSNGDTMHYYSNHGQIAKNVAPGLYGISNAHLDAPWPKTELAKTLLDALIKRNDAVAPQDLIAVTASTEEFPHNLLPNTGIGVEKEKQLSAPFIRMEGQYGTRATSAILWDHNNKVQFLERTFAYDIANFTDSYYEFVIQQPV